MYYLFEYYKQAVSTCIDKLIFLLAVGVYKYMQKKHLNCTLFWQGRFIVLSRRLSLDFR
jgi:hypothetical protein